MNDDELLTLTTHAFVNENEPGIPEWVDDELHWFRSDGTEVVDHPNVRMIVGVTVPVRLRRSDIISVQPDYDSYGLDWIGSMPSRSRIVLRHAQHDLTVEEDCNTVLALLGWGQMVYGPSTAIRTRP